MAATATEDILALSATFFESQLYDSPAGARALSRLERAGVQTEVLREFWVGYAPGDVTELASYLDKAGHSREDLVLSGLAKRSDREHMHILFHARIMFPIRDRDGVLAGFAGLATHLGPSWPLWVTPPETEAYRSATALFGIDRAAAAMAETGRALVKRDCVEVLRLHQAGRADSVAVIHSPVTAQHLAEIAESIGMPARELAVTRSARLDATVIHPRDVDVDQEAFGELERPYGAVPIAATIRSDWVDDSEPGEPIELESERPDRARIWIYLAGLLIGAGIPLGILLVVAPEIEEGRTGATPALNAVIAGVAAAYLILMVVVARASARQRDRSRARRMRPPWARGSGEWQPSGWTYHRVEEVLIGAALISALTCFVLWMTLGGFLG